MESYTINAWGNAKYILDAALVFCYSIILYILCPPFESFVNDLFAIIKRFI
jgi:hypothetical protein